MNRFPKLVDTPHYHVWTDALHARSLAHQARNEWDRGTYVRWCVATAWTALEVACQDATGDDSISYSFRKHLDRALARMRLPPLNWGSGTWQQVSKVHEFRKDYVHRFARQADLFPEASVADEAIEAVRNGITEIYKHVGLSVPPWVADDEDRGWHARTGMTAHATVVRAGADPNSVDAIRICYVQDGTEHVAEVLPPGVRWDRHIDDLIHSVNVPISEVRVYQGQTLVESRKLPMRGA